MAAIIEHSDVFEQNSISTSLSSLPMPHAHAIQSCQGRCSCNLFPQSAEDFKHLAQQSQSQGCRAVLTIVLSPIRLWQVSPKV
jgi:hypothetical protein